MNEDTLNELLEAVSQIQPTLRPSSPPCNNFSDSMLAGPLPTTDDRQQEEYDPVMPAYDPSEPSYQPSSSFSSTYSPLLGEQPVTSGRSENEKFNDFSHYVQQTFERLIKRIEEQEIELKILREQAERRHNRHTLCITELQDKVFKSISHKRKRENPSLSSSRSQLQQLQLMALLEEQPLQAHPHQQPLAHREYQSSRDLRTSSSSSSYSPTRECEQYSPTRGYEKYSTVDEVKIKEAIGQFLCSWNRNYRCGHHYRDSCKFEDRQCYRFHENAKHSIIAKELRAVLQSGGEISTSNFFVKIQEEVDNGYNCGKTLQSMKAEILGLAHNQ